MNLYRKVCEKCCKYTMLNYSISFSMATRLLLPKDLRQPIVNIYAFCRFADEIVDTFHDYDKQQLLADFQKETFQSIGRGLSVNPILHSFQLTVNEYGIPHDLIKALFRSMEMDLHKKKYNESEYREYVYGSSQAVGLMCIAVFCEKDFGLYDEVKASAEILGAALQKVDLLRDLRVDLHELNRNYFPFWDLKNLTVENKLKIEADIQEDFDKALPVIRNMPAKAKLYLHCLYELNLPLFKKLKRTSPQKIMEKTISIPGYMKFYILAKAKLKYMLGIL